MSVTLDDLLAGRADDELRTVADWSNLWPGRGMSPRVMVRWHVAGVRGHRLHTLRIGHRHTIRGVDLRLFLESIPEGDA